MSAISRRFRRADRVLTSREYRDVARRGRRSSSGAFVLLWCVDEQARGAKLGLTVSRKVGNAVIRNRVKRRVREWFRLGGRLRLDGGSLVVIARRAAAELSWKELAGQLDQQLGEIAG